jgi:protein SCO1/2
VRPILQQLAFAALAVLAGGACASGSSLAPELRERSFTDSDGRELRLSALQGPLIVMSMAYGNCRKVCKATTVTLAEIQKRLDRMNARADFVIVSYDPVHDTPAAWSDWRARRHLDRGNWHFLSGDPESTRRIARDLDLNFWTYDDHIVHDFRIVMFDAKWQWLGEIDEARREDLDRVLARVLR